MAFAYARGEGKTFDHTPSAAVVAGSMEELDATDNFVGVYMTNLAANEKGALQVQGVFEITKAVTTATWGVGDALAITVTTPTTMTVAAAATGSHRAAAASANGDTTALVKINCMN